MTPPNPHPNTIQNTAVPDKPQAAPGRPLPAFPESVLHPGRTRWRRRLRTTVICVAGLAVVAGGVLVVQRVAADDGPTLRTATVASEAVIESYHAVATIEPTTRAQVAFPVAGTVQAVAVAVGDTVAIGDTLASVDTSDLQQALHEAESTLASARLTLNIALSGEDPSTSGSAGAGGITPGGAANGVTFEFATASLDAYVYVLTSTSDEAAAAREAVTAAQSAVTGAANTAAARRDAAMSICAAVNVTIDPDDPGGSLDTISSSLGACQAALDELMAAQDALTAAQDQLTSAADTLDALLAEWAAELEDRATTTTTTTAPTTTVPGSTTVPEPPSTTAPSSSTPDTSTPTTTTPRPPGGGPSGGGGSLGGATNGGGAAPSGGTTAPEAEEPTAAELIAYQAAYDAAARAVEAARQALAQATIVSPIGGTVVAVNLAAGDTVTEASDTATIVVQGSGGYEATLSVSVDDIDRISVGQRAELVPDGGGEAVAGEVVAISQVPDSSGTTANYRVTVGLAGDAEQLRDGNIGDVAIVVERGDGTIAVPTSAVTPTGTGYTVDVVGTDGTVSTVQVEIGAVGTEWTEIRRGLELGQTVVVADLDEPLPGAATDSSGGTGTGQVPAVFPGGPGLPAGGFPGGRIAPAGAGG